MGKGDKKTKRGKIILGSHGVTRPRKKGNVNIKPMMVAEVKVEEPVKPKPKPKAPRKPKEEQI